MQRHFVIGVPEVNIAVLDLAAHRLGERLKLCGVLALLGGVENVEHPLATGPGRLKHLVQPVQLADRLVKQREIKQEANQLPDRHLLWLREHLTAADPQHQTSAKCSYKAH